MGAGTVRSGCFAHIDHQKLLPLCLSRCCEHNMSPGSRVFRLAVARSAVVSDARTNLPAVQVSKRSRHSLADEDGEERRSRNAQTRPLIGRISVRISDSISDTFHGPSGVIFPRNYRIVINSRSFNRRDENHGFLRGEDRAVYYRFAEPT